MVIVVQVIKIFGLVFVKVYYLFVIIQFNVLVYFFGYEFWFVVGFNQYVGVEYLVFDYVVEIDVVFCWFVCNDFLCICIYKQK